MSRILNLISLAVAKTTAPTSALVYPALPFLYAARYRDWVIDSLNADKPYNRFVAEQIAGDLTPAKTVLQRRDQIVGTGMVAWHAEAQEQAWNGYRALRERIGRERGWGPPSRAEFGSSAVATWR